MSLIKKAILFKWFMVIKAKPKILRPEYSCSNVRYLHKSSIESTLCCCRRCYRPPSPPSNWVGVGGMGGGDCFKVKQNKNSPQKCTLCLFVVCWPNRHLRTFFLNEKMYHFVFKSSKMYMKLKSNYFWPSYVLFCEVWFHDFLNLAEL